MDTTSLSNAVTQRDTTRRNATQNANAIKLNNACVGMRATMMHDVRTFYEHVVPILSQLRFNTTRTTKS